MQPRPNGVPQLDLKQIGNKNAQQSPASSSSTTAGSDRNTTPIVLSPQQQQKQGEPGSSSKPLRRNGIQGKRPPQGNVSFYTNTQPRPTSSGGLTPRTFLGQSRSKDSISNGARRRGNVLEPQWGQGMISMMLAYTFCTRLSATANFKMSHPFFWSSSRRSINDPERLI